jgi:hypothetical protein
MLVLAEQAFRIATKASLLSSEQAALLSNSVRVSSRLRHLPALNFRSTEYSDW